MSLEPPLPARLAQLRPEENLTKAGRLFRSAIEAPEEPLPPIARRIRHTLGQQGQRPRHVFRVALVGAVIFLTGGVVGAAVWPHWGKPRVTPAPAQSPESKSVAPGRKSSRARPSIGAPESMADQPGQPAKPVATDEAKPQPTETSRSQPTAVPRRIALREDRPVARIERTSEPAAAPPSLVPPSVGWSDIAPPAPIHVPEPDEHGYLLRALQVLRSERNPAGALAVLDDYVAHFPHHALDLEAGMLRAEALLSLGRSRGALAELDRLPLQSLPNRDARHALRGELRAAAGRWRDAIADFDAVLTKRAEADARGTTGTGDVVERALWGRASARSHLGDDGGARSDLGQYLLHFPHGRFASEARRLLAAQP